MTHQSKIKGKGNCRFKSNRRFAPLRIRASANAPVGMTPKFKIKGNGKSKGKGNRRFKSNRRFLHCAFAQARTLRSE